MSTDIGLVALTNWWGLIGLAVLLTIIGVIVTYLMPEKRDDEK